MRRGPDILYFDLQLVLPGQNPFGASEPLGNFMFRVPLVNHDFPKDDFPHQLLYKASNSGSLFLFSRNIWEFFLAT